SLAAWIAGLGMAWGLAPARAAAGQEKVYGLDEAVNLALAQNPRMSASRHLSAANRDSAWSTRGHLLPLVKLGATYDYVKANEGLDLGAFSGGSSSSSRPLYLNAWAGDFNVTVAQPVLGLLHISQDFAGASRAADASDADVKAN